MYGSLVVIRATMLIRIRVVPIPEKLVMGFRYRPKKLGGPPYSALQQGRTCTALECGT